MMTKERLLGMIDALRLLERTRGIAPRAEIYAVWDESLQEDLVAIAKQVEQALINVSRFGGGSARLQVCAESREAVVEKLGISTKRPRAHPTCPWLFAQSVEGATNAPPDVGGVIADVLFGPVDFIVEPDPDTPTIVE